MYYYNGIVFKGRWIQNMKYARFLSDTLTIGEKMLCSGAEVSRVEDSIIRKIGRAHV